MAATASMKAALVLSFEDQLSSGLSKLEKQLDELKQIGKGLSLGKLQSASEDLQPGIAATRMLAGELRGVGVAANSASADLKKVTGAYANLQRERSFTRNDAAMVWGGASRPRLEAARGGGGMGGMMGELAAVGAGYGALQSARAYADFEDIARRAAITKGLSGPALEADDKRLMALFSRDALETGQKGTNIGEAYLDLAGMGIAPGEVERLLPIHSRVATAYNITPAELSPATAALNQSFKISDADMGGALAAMATAAKEGRFKVGDFAHFLPQIGGNMAGLGMTGRGSADEAFAALETVMKNAAEPGSGATNFTQFMNDLTSPHAARTFALKSKQMGPSTRRMLEEYHITGIDLPKLLENAGKQGIDPLTAVLAKLQQKVAGLPPVAMKEVLGGFFTNEQSRDAVQALLQHIPEYLAIRKQLDGVDQGTLDRDFQSRMVGSKVQMQLFDEELAQFDRRLGMSFTPAVKGATSVLDDLNSEIDALNQTVPGLGDNVVAIGASALGIGAAFGTLSLLMPTAAAKIVSGFKGLLALADGPQILALPLLLHGDTPVGPEYKEAPGSEWFGHNGPIARWWNAAANDSGRMKHEEGVGGPSDVSGTVDASYNNVPIPEPPTVHVYVGVDPASGVVHIPRVDSSGNVSVTNVYQLPDAGQTTSRP